MSLLLFLGVAYLRSSVLAGRCRWFRLHSAGVSLSIPPVAPADVPAIPAQELGHLPAVLKCAYPAGDVYLRWLLHRAWQDACHWITTCGAIASTADVHLSIPPVAPADVPAIFHPRIGTSTCGANINYTFFPKKCILFERRTQNVRLMCYLCSVNIK